MLLINGMPVIHVELKRSGIDVSQACEQIHKYSDEGVFTGLFSLVQIFVAMTPEDMVYFANPGRYGKFNPLYYFHWADINNNPIKEWKKVCDSFLYIPMAHQLVGWYTVPDDTDGVLKVLRSYQYWAVYKISSTVQKVSDWHARNIYGGYVWHATGSGKTLTSFKAAQLISNSDYADKVVYLADRTELGTQALDDYRGFALDDEEIYSTKNTLKLINLLKDTDKSKKMIVTSIQKMSKVKLTGMATTIDIEKINNQRIVFIVDECHRDTFGDMLKDIKATFPHAIFFGFSGTPIFDENMKKLSTTADLFGNELCRYLIPDGIRDGNILGFDPDAVEIYSSNDLRKEVALQKAKAKDVDEVYSCQEKIPAFEKYMDKCQVTDAGYDNNLGIYVKGIEDEIPDSQYETPNYQEQVVKDIFGNWSVKSSGKKFSAIFATSSIFEAIQYYNLLKNKGLKVTALFDPSDDNNGSHTWKEPGIVDILEDYNKTFHQNFKMSTYADFKEDVSHRLARVKEYDPLKPEGVLDLLIVVDQMLTGFDSKWLNTLYLDKVLKSEHLIQAFSRTNRLFGPEKPFGKIVYYRRPATMARNIEIAIKQYCGDKPYGVLVDKLPNNVEIMNECFGTIKEIFENAGVSDFSRLPPSNGERGKFAKTFSILYKHLKAAEIQGFDWNLNAVQIGATPAISFTKKDFLILVLRYKELFNKRLEETEEPPFNIDTSITHIPTERINADYMNSRFKKYLLDLTSGASEDTIRTTLNELSRSFASLSVEDQKYANMLIRDIQTGTVKAVDGKTLSDYINEYKVKAKNDQIHRFAVLIGLDETQLRELMGHDINDTNIDDYGRYTRLKGTLDRKTTKQYFDNEEGKDVPMRLVLQKADLLIRRFVIAGGFEIHLKEETKDEQN
jgi:type I restriction enzyme R subunit